MDGANELPTGAKRRVLLVFWLIVALGGLLRIVVCSSTEGIIHPDEHQMYLETAQGMVYGYHVQFWEHVRGVRHYLYPTSMAAVLYALDGAGVGDPLWQVALIRMLIGLAALGSVTWFAYRWLQQGRAMAALCLICLYALAPDVINMDRRTLSETVSAVVLVLGIALVERQRPLAAGVLFGLMFAVRFQTILFVPSFLFFALVEDWRARLSWRNSAFLRLSAGLALSLGLVGLIDRLTWGGWFHSPIEYFSACILEGIAAGFGVEPWHYYAARYSGFLIGAFPLLLLLPIALVGASRELRLTVAALSFALPHMAIAHKELRFLWPVVPLALIIAAAGLEWFWQRRVVAGWRLRLGTALAVVLLAGFAMRATQVPWIREPNASSSIALAQVGRRADVTGVAVCGNGPYSCGNYFYLRRNVPLMVNWRAEKIKACPEWVDGTLNYLIAPIPEMHKFAECRLSQVGAVGDFGIYQRLGSETAAGPSGE